jgi:two-component system response regulator PfeR
MDAPAAYPPAGRSDQAKRALRILVIDDDDCVGPAIQFILARRNDEAVLAARAYAGIQTLASSAFDAVIIDLFMPGMNGLDTIAHIRRGSAIPIIAMSGFKLRNSLNATDYPCMAMERGASAFLRKPFASHELFEAIDRNLMAAHAPGDFIS